MTQILSLHFGDCTLRRSWIPLRGKARQLAGTDELSDPLVSSYYAPFQVARVVVVVVLVLLNSAREYPHPGSRFCFELSQSLEESSRWGIPGAFFEIVDKLR